MRRISPSAFATMLLALAATAFGQSSFKVPADDPTAPTGRAADVGVGNNARVDPVTVAIPQVNPVAQMPIGSGASTAPGAENAAKGSTRRNLPSAQNEKVMCFVAGQGYVMTDAIACNSRGSQTTRMARQPARLDKNSVRPGATGGMEAPLPTSPEELQEADEQTRLAGKTRMTGQRAEQLQSIQLENSSNPASSGFTNGNEDGASSVTSLIPGSPRRSTAKLGSTQNQANSMNPTGSQSAANRAMNPSGTQSAADQARNQALRSAHESKSDTHQQAQTRYEKCQELAKNKNKSMKDERIYQKTCATF